MLSLEKPNCNKEILLKPSFAIKKWNKKIYKGVYYVTIQNKEKKFMSLGVVSCNSPWMHRFLIQRWWAKSLIMYHAYSDSF